MFSRSVDFDFSYKFCLITIYQERFVGIEYAEM